MSVPSISYNINSPHRAREPLWNRIWRKLNSELYFILNPLTDLVLSPDTASRDGASRRERHVEDTVNRGSIRQVESDLRRSNSALERARRADSLEVGVVKCGRVAGESGDAGCEAAGEVEHDLVDHEGRGEAATSSGLDETVSGRHCKLGC